MVIVSIFLKHNPYFSCEALEKGWMIISDVVLMFKTIKIESNLELQYNLIDIRDGEKRFIFSFKCFDDNHTSTPQAYRIQSAEKTGT